MAFRIPEYMSPDLSKKKFAEAPDVTLVPAPADGIAPDNYHATSIYPEYYKISGNWVLAEKSRMDCVTVIDRAGRIEIKEFRRIRKGDLIVAGRTEDGSEGIYVHERGFGSKAAIRDKFAFRTSDSRETSKSWDYDRLYDILNHDRDNGRIVWVLGPAVTFDKDARDSMIKLIESGFVHAVLAGNALATHDLEVDLFRTALGQDIYTKDSKALGHYHHLDVINTVRRHGSIEKLIGSGRLKSGIIHACYTNGISVTLASSIRDDGPLPEVIQNASLAQDEMRKQIGAATTVIALATQLHAIAVGNMTPAYHVRDGKIRPVFFYIVDMSEFVLKKLKDRGSLEVTAIASNVHDFLFILKQGLVKNCARKVPLAT